MPRVRAIILVGWSVAIGLMFEIVVERILDFVDGEYDWMKGPVCLIIGVITTAIFIYTWEAEDIEEEEEEEETHSVEEPEVISNTENVL